MSGMCGSASITNLVPVSVWKQCSSNVSVDSSSMPVQLGIGDSWPAIACSECLCSQGIQLISAVITWGRVLGHQQRRNTHHVLASIMMSFVLNVSAPGTLKNSCAAVVQHAASAWARCSPPPAVHQAAATRPAPCGR